jgi:hypothetical protein
MSLTSLKTGRNGQNYKTAIVYLENCKRMEKHNLVDGCFHQANSDNTRECLKVYGTLEQRNQSETLQSNIR